MRGLSAVLIMTCTLTWAVVGGAAQKRGGDPKAAARKNPVPSTAASIKTGQQVYAKQCRHCHGLKGVGDGPMAPKNPSPANLTDATWDHGSTDGEIFRRHLERRPGAEVRNEGHEGDAGREGRLEHHQLPA